MNPNSASQPNLCECLQICLCETELVILSDSRVEKKSGNQKRKSEGKAFHMDMFIFLSGNFFFHAQSFQMNIRQDPKVSHV